MELFMMISGGEIIEAGGTTRAMALRQNHAWLFGTKQEHGGTCDFNGVNTKNKNKNKTKHSSEGQEIKHMWWCHCRVQMKWNTTAGG